MIRLTLRAPTKPPRTLTPDADPITVGRAPGNTVVVPDGRVSSFHAQIARRADTWVFMDLGSRNGSILERGGARTVLDGREVREATLRDGDRVLLGDAIDPVALDVAIDALPGTTETAPLPSATVVAARAASDLEARSDAWLDANGQVLRRLALLGARVAAQTSQQAAMRVVADAVFDLVPGAESLLWVPLEPDARRLVALRGAAVREVTPDEAPVSRAMLTRLARTGEALLWGEHEGRGPDASLARLGVRTAAAVRVEAAAALVVHAAPRRTLDEPALDALVVVGRQVGTAIIAAGRAEASEREARALRDENRDLRNQVADVAPFPRLIGRSAAMQAVFEQMRAVAHTTTTVLVLGETGTGKELVARSLHEASPRAARRFAAVNCAALSDTLLDGELFGHMRGAFTGADRDRDGLFVAADGGTLFLDEIGEITPALQVKLLRALQEGQVMPVGATTPRDVDVRVVAATNRDLTEEVAAGRFRADLYYRIHVFPVALPPLRDRGRDVELLALFFLTQSCAKLGRSNPGLSDDARARLRAWSWPGNIRELANEIERATLMTPAGEPLPESALSDRLRSTIAPTRDRVSDLHETMERLEKQVVLKGLEENGWNRTQTAKVLGISRQALQVKLAKWGLRPD